MKAIEIKHISKRYGKIEALKDVSLSVDRGEIFGFIGPDGSGKTTLFRILATLLLPDKGEAKVLGNDVIRDMKLIRQRLGYMPGRFLFTKTCLLKRTFSFLPICLARQ